MFSYPVDKTHPIKTYYGQKGKDYPNSIDPDNGLWLPVKDQDGFGNSSGYDFDCPPGTIVRAMADGFIVRAAQEGSLILQLVILPGYDSWMLKYDHLQRIYVLPSEKIYRGDTLGQSGEPHLHVDLMAIRGKQWKPIQFED